MQVPNSNRSAAGTSDLRARMTEEAIMCNHGYRAMTSDDSVPIVVPCDGPLEFMSACGGGPSLGQINYNPCGWNRAVTCRPVSCLVAPLADGTQTVSKGTIANISNVHYMVRMPCAMSCDPRTRLASPMLCRDAKRHDSTAAEADTC